MIENDLQLAAGPIPCGFDLAVLCYNRAMIVLPGAAAA